MFLILLLAVLVEDFKKIDKEYAVVGFSNGVDVVIPGVIEIMKMAHGGHFGVACQGKVMPVEGFENQVSKFKQYILDVGFVGLFDFDFYQSGGKMYFGELNLRFGGSGYAVTKLGVNLPGMLVRSFRGEDTTGMPKDVVGIAVYANERMCHDDWYNGYTSFSQYRKQLNAADVLFLKDTDDPQPERRYLLELLVSIAKKAVKRIIHHA